MSTGSLIRLLREAKGLTQKELAKEVGTYETAISRYENDKAKPPIELSQKLAKVFEVSVDYLFKADAKQPDSRNIYNEVGIPVGAQIPVIGVIRAGVPIFAEENYEGYTRLEIAYAINNRGADWKEQAVLKAQSYLDIMPFSREGLIDQLEYEGFTHNEAVYGVDHSGY